MVVHTILIFVGAIRQPLADGLGQEDTISCYPAKITLIF
jgi:hypothetical protein